MLEDKLQRVREIFERHVPYLTFKSLESASQRNNLLAHYLVEHLPGDQVRAVLKADTGKDCIPKLALADESYFYTARPSITLPKKQPREGGEYKEDYLGEAKTPEKAAHCMPRSTLDKAVLVYGVRLYKEIFSRRNTPRKITQATADPKDITHLFATPAFRGVSEGADLNHAANCYVALLMEHLANVEETERSAYEGRLGAARDVADLRRLLGFIAYHQRTPTSELKQDNISALTDLTYSTELVFLNAVANWNKSLLLRLDKSA